VLPLQLQQPRTEMAAQASEEPVLS
jgi:hypothetical protein